MNYLQYDIHTAPENVDMLIAFLSDSPFDTFQETETGFLAFMPDAGAEAEADALLARLQGQFAFRWQTTQVAGQNWNELWEQNFQPVVVRDFCAVRADFHDPIPGVRFELRIQPKMAFGTGHHETTWMCMNAMENLPMQAAKVLDYGCGTGILAILASKLGAAHIEAVDIESASYENTQENCLANEVSNVQAFCGTLDAIPGRDFDGILANINRNVLLDSMTDLAARTRTGGWLLLSGILKEDEAAITDSATAQGYAKVSVQQRGNWLCIHFVKRH